MTANQDTLDKPQAIALGRERLLGLIRNLEKVIHGKRDVLELLVCCLGAGGHVLLEDIPGTGKTTLAKAIALSAGCIFKRVQFTPDLLPTDIVGASVYNPREGTFHFNPGPVFTNILIADEINRASPRTQSALLEAMGEQQVSVDGKTYPLDHPFFCIATQNPVDFHGTYPLPEAQFDRFSVALTLGYVTESQEREILISQQFGHPLDNLAPITSPPEILQVQQAVQLVTMEQSVLGYLLALVGATRTERTIRIGVSTRGSLQFAKMVRAKALLAGRDFVLPEDLKSLAIPVLAHRLVLDTKAKYAGADKKAIISEITEKIPIPR